MAYKILVIDDTPVIRDFLSEVLSDSGYEVDIASDGQSGYDKAINEDYVMIFCDVHMPVMNGLETIKRIKQAKPDMPVVMTDSFPDRLANEATQAGAMCCLAKPFALDEVRDTVERIIRGKAINVK
ncbi:MAG: response regulator [Candidatus Zixiibacteriota bacterium]|nr:MAG: response regulator [candidate division Zixibacteria bacterium]